MTQELIKADRILKIAREVREDKRTWVKSGSFYNIQGYTVFPVMNDELEFYLVENTISKIVEVDELHNEIHSAYCRNSETAMQIFQAIESL